MSGFPADPAWLWLIGGVLLLIAELIAPGFSLIFIGAAGIATGVLSLALGLPVALQLVPGYEAPLPCKDDCLGTRPDTKFVEQMRKVVTDCLFADAEASAISALLNPSARSASVSRSRRESASNAESDLARRSLPGELEHGILQNAPTPARAPAARD